MRDTRDVSPQNEGGSITVHGAEIGEGDRPF